MKRRVLAWVTAAAMLITSVPGNAITAFAEEVPEVISAETVSDEEPVKQEDSAEEVEEILAADPELAEDSAAAQIQDEDVSEEETDSANDELVEDFTVEEDDPEADALQDGMLIAAEEDSSEEDDPYSEEEIQEAENDSEITGIELSCPNASELFDSDSENFMGWLSQLLRATVTYAEGEPETVNDWSWYYYQIGENQCYVFADYSTGVGIMAKNSSGEILPDFVEGSNATPVGGEVWFQPFILDSEDYDWQ